MTRLKIEIAAEDDIDALNILAALLKMMLKSLDERFRHTLTTFGTATFEKSLAPGYGTSDMSGSSECTVTREPDSILYTPIPKTQYGESMGDKAQATAAGDC